MLVLHGNAAIGKSTLNQPLQETAVIHGIAEIGQSTLNQPYMKFQCNMGLQQ